MTRVRASEVNREKNRSDGSGELSVLVAVPAKRIMNQSATCKPPDGEPFVETELEWRVRLTLREAQIVMDKWLRGSYCIADAYRLRRHAGFVRRVGSRVHHERYDFQTLADYVRLNGLRGLPSDDQTNDCSTTRPIVDYFSEVKTTNCAHLLFVPTAPRQHQLLDDRLAELARAYDEQCDSHNVLELDNAWPRLFVFKRSLELHNCSVHTDSLEQTADIENDKSDNNLGASVVRKIYRFVETRDLSTGSRPRTLEFRIALYSFLDEYQQIRYELAVEHEFENAATYRSPFEMNVDANVNRFRRVDHPANSTNNDDDNEYNVCRRVMRVPSDHVQAAIEALSYLSRTICHSSLIYHAPTMPTLNIDWTNQDIGTSATNYRPSNYSEHGNNVNVADSEARSMDNDDEYDEMHRRVATDEGSIAVDDIGASSSNSTLSRSTASTSGHVVGSDANGETCSVSDVNESLGQDYRLGGGGSGFEIAGSSNAKRGNACSLNGRLLSYTLDVGENGSLDVFVRYVRDHLVAGLKSGRLIVRRKMDGERVYASFSGLDLLYMENGHSISLGEDACYFSPNFVYQFERLTVGAKEKDGEGRGSTRETCYVLTEVVAVRNNYSHEPNALLHSFSPSVSRYAYTPDQQWPYGLDCTGLSDREVADMLYFWSCSACPSVDTNRLYEKLVGQLRRSPQQLSHPTDNVVASCGHSTVLANSPRFLPSTLNNNRNFTDLSLADSLVYLARMNASTSSRVLVNTQIDLRADSTTFGESEFLREVANFYRYSVLRLVDIVYANLLPRLGRQMLHLHFPADEANEFHRTYMANYQEQGFRPRLLVRLARRFQQSLPIDGYLVYMSKDNAGDGYRSGSSETSAVCAYPCYARETCAFDIVCDANASSSSSSSSLSLSSSMSRHMAAFKFKPFQTVELLCVITPSNAGIDLRNISFCVRATIAEQQQDLNSHAYLTAKNVPLLDGRTVRTGAVNWENVFGGSVALYCDLDVVLRHKQIYEFTVYNDTTFFLMCERNDKIVADSEKKVNSIIYKRKKLTREFQRCGNL